MAFQARVADCSHSHHRLFSADVYEPIKGKSITLVVLKVN